MPHLLGCSAFAIYCSSVGLVLSGWMMFLLPARNTWSGFGKGSVSTPCLLNHKGKLEVEEINSSTTLGGGCLFKTWIDTWDTCCVNVSSCRSVRDRLRARLQRRAYPPGTPLPNGGAAPAESCMRLPSPGEWPAAPIAPASQWIMSWRPARGREKDRDTHTSTVNGRDAEVTSWMRWGYIRGGENLYM